MRPCKERKAKVMILITGKVIAVKNYGFGFIDCCGNFYNKNQVQFLEVIE